MKVHTIGPEEHLRNYFLFNYENDYRLMIENDIIGLSGVEKDLSIVFNAADPKNELMHILSNENDITQEDKRNYEKLFFAMEIGDAVCLADTKSIWAIGIIESNYKYTPNKELPHARKVKWLSKEKISLEDGNPRIKIRAIEKETSYDIIENIINKALLDEGDSGLLINYPSRITVDRYLSFFKKIKLNPHEIEVLNVIYNNQNNGISIFELQKLFVGIDVEESMELLARKISKRFRLGRVENRYAPNLFNGILRDGHLCLVMKDEFAKALNQSGIVEIAEYQDETKYTFKHAQKDSVYPLSWYEDAYNLLKTKHNLHIIGDWGTGKSYFARRLAFLLIESRDMNNIFHLKMHPSLKYDDLLSGDGSRPLYRFIEQARKNAIDNYVIIFEDCHEANLNEVIGELAYLMEDNNRDREGALDVNFDDKKYYIPKNVYIITTSRDNPGLFDPHELSNILIYIMPGIFNKKFVNMFEDYALGEFIATNFVKVNKIIEKYDLSLNHGLFLKKSRGITVKEYEIVLKYKLIPILKRLVSDEDYEKIIAKIDYKKI